MLNAMLNSAFALGAGRIRRPACVPHGIFIYSFDIFAGCPNDESVTLLSGQVHTMLYSSCASAMSLGIANQRDILLQKPAPSFGGRKYLCRKRLMTLTSMSICLYVSLLKFDQHLGYAANAATSWDLHAVPFDVIIS